MKKKAKLVPNPKFAKSTNRHVWSIQAVFTNLRAELHGILTILQTWARARRHKKGRISASTLDRDLDKNTCRLSKGF